MHFLTVVEFAHDLRCEVGNALPNLLFAEKDSLAEASLAEYDLPLGTLGTWAARR